MTSTFSTKTGAVLLVAVLVLGGIPGLATAETRGGGSVVVGPDETVQGDLDTFAGTVVVHGTVDGDLAAFAGDVTVDGEVTGDVKAFAGNVRVTGVVGGNVDAASGNVAVARDAEIGGDLSAAAGSVVLDGTVRGNAEVAGETVTLGPTANVDGDLTYDGELTRADGAVVAGTVTRDAGLAVGPTVETPLPVVPEWVGGVYWFLVSLGAAAVLLAVFPRFSATVAARAVESPLRTGGVGLLTLVGVPLALVVVALTIVGIPLTILGAVLFAMLAWVGSLYGRVAVGTWLASLADVENRWAGLLAGFAAVALVTRIPVVGGVVELVVFLLGLGALSVALYRAYRRSRPGDTVDDGATDDGVADDGVVEESGGRPA